MNKIQEAFEAVKADDRLKSAAMEAVKKKLSEESLKEQKSEKSGKIYFGRKFLYAAAVCCMLIFAVGIFGFYSAYTSPVSYVSIDINPSVELILNRFNVVIETNAYNDDGSKIVEAVDVNNMGYEEAIDKLIESEEFGSYFENDYELIFTVISDNQEEIIQGIENTQCYKKYGSACVGADYETRQEALEYGMSFGKYRAYQELLKYYPDITPEECSELSMNEIKNLILEKGGEWNGVSQNQECTNPSNENKGQNTGNQNGQKGQSSQGNSGSTDYLNSSDNQDTGNGSGSGAVGEDRYQGGNQGKNWDSRNN